ncbi:MAG TPA: 30S ribosomal protein S4 [Candidatus Paceibacterota bacterium]
MIIGPKYKIARRLGDAIFPKTQKPRFAMVESKKRANLTKKRKHRSNTTEFGLQFLEKQKVRYTYGLGERQMANYIKKAKSAPGTKPLDELFKLLERRLDNVVFRTGLASTRQFGRQISNHGHITVNGKRVSIPSYTVKVGDKIGVYKGSAAKTLFKDKAAELKEMKTPTWIKFSPETLEATITALPMPGENETNLNFGSVVQFYSRV